MEEGRRKQEPLVVGASKAGRGRAPACAPNIHRLHRKGAQVEACDMFVALVPELHTETKQPCHLA